MLVVQSCLTLCDPMYCSLPGSSVHGILQAGILEWVAISFSRGSSWSMDQTMSPALQADSLLSEPPGKPKCNVKCYISCWIWVASLSFIFWNFMEFFFSKHFPSFDWIHGYPDMKGRLYFLLSKYQIPSKYIQFQIKFTGFFWVWFCFNLSCNILLWVFGCGI